MNFDDWLIEARKAFPLMGGHNCRPTSPSDERYNCIAWASGVSDRWWWPDSLGQNYWPRDVTRAGTLAAFTEMFGRAGFREVNDATSIPGVDKIAVYVGQQGLPTHAARQLPDGWWSSKLGMDVDVKHHLAALEGPVYGSVALILARSRG